MKTENWIEETLAALREGHCLRTLRTLPGPGGHIVIGGRSMINFSSNDYLNFIHRKELLDAAVSAAGRLGSGSGASRLVTGNLELHEELEAMMARHKGYPSALLFGSGFLTNLGAVNTLVSRGDTVVADRLVHASLIDAIRLSGARLLRFHHNDADHAAECLSKAGGSGRVLLVTESVFSMDGDIAPLTDLAGAADRHGAMFMVDEAHATGVFGRNGRGLVAQLQLQERVNLSMCTLSKAIGSYGGVAACSSMMRDLLINSARSFIYTTSLPPAVCAAALAAVELLELEPQLGPDLLRRADLFRQALREQGFRTGTSQSQIIPVMVGANEDALQLARALEECGVIATAIRPPTVPKGTARLRFSVTLAHGDDEMRSTAEKLRSCVDRLGLHHILNPS